MDLVGCVVEKGNVCGGEAAPTLFAGSRAERGRGLPGELQCPRPPGRGLRAAHPQETWFAFSNLWFWVCFAILLIFQSFLLKHINLNHMKLWVFDFSDL